MAKATFEQMSAKVCLQLQCRSCDRRFNPGDQPGRKRRPASDRLLQGHLRTNESLVFPLARGRLRRAASSCARASAAVNADGSRGIVAMPSEAETSRAEVFRPFTRRDRRVVKTVFAGTDRSRVHRG